MKTLVAHIGSQEICQKAVVLMLLKSVNARGIRRVELSHLHRAFGVMRRNLEDSIPSDRLDVIPNLRRLRYGFAKADENGFYPDMVRVLQDFEIYSIRTFDMSEENGVIFMQFTPLADELLSSMLEKMCEFSPEEQEELDKLVLYAVGFLRRIRD